MLVENKYGELVDPDSGRNKLIQELRYQIDLQLRSADKEKAIRDNNPAVKEAYEKYLVLLELARTNNG